MAHIDTLISVAAVLRGARPDWSVIEIKGAGHSNCIFKPDFRDEVAAWIRRQGKQ